MMEKLKVDVIIPVSYTHLTRTKIKYLPMEKNIFSLILSRSLIWICCGQTTVSYTHLDVYKRQA